MGKSERLELRADEEFMETLDSLSGKIKVSRAEVIRQAVALYAETFRRLDEGFVLVYQPAPPAVAPGVVAGAVGGSGPRMTAVNGSQQDITASLPAHPEWTI